MLTALVLLATVLIRFTIVVSAVYLLLPRSGPCPRCGGRPAAVRHRLLARLVPVVEHRWCLECGWSGIVRRSAARDQARRALVEEIVPRPVQQDE